MKTDKAFTLAEVLVTLGIIGVVASMTMPMLISNTRKKEFSARLSKFYSTMQQAILMYNTQHNMLAEDWEIPEKDNPEAIEEFWKSHFAPYFKGVINEEQARNEFTSWRNGIVINFNDGTKMSITRGGTIDIKFDVNGEKPPNTSGRDQYIFLLNKGEFTPYNWAGDIKDMTPDDGGDAYSTNLNDRSNVLRLCKHDSTFCSQLLLLDGWEYKDDYPRRI